jgi:hypothetical protein
VDREERLESNEKLFREVNERVDEMEDGLGSDSPSQWVCECGDETCFDRLTVARDEYHQIRSHEDWFIISPGHEKADVERVVRKGNGYTVVEKTSL